MKHAMKFHGNSSSSLVFALIVFIVMSFSRIRIISALVTNTNPLARISSIRGLTQTKMNAPPQAIRILPTTTFMTSSSGVNTEPVSLVEVDVRHGVRTSLSYDPQADRFVDSDILSASQPMGAVNGQPRPKSKKVPLQLILKRGVSNAFLPEGVTPSYYNFIRWRIIQRFVNANVHVFGTQSLLMGLGINKRSALGLSAALNWVLKDALGKIGESIALNEIFLS